MTGASDPRAEVTRLLQAAGRGEDGAAEELAAAVYQELRRMAGARMAHEAAGVTLQPTALVHETWVRLEQGGQDWKNRAHYFGAAGEAMRRILVEQARRRASQKRGGAQRRADLDAAEGVAAAPGTDGLDLVALDTALARMEQTDSRMASIVKLRYFVGLSVDDTAAALDLSRRTVLREWTAAKAWLHRELSGECG